MSDFTVNVFNQSYKRAPTMYTALTTTQLPLTYPNMLRPIRAIIKEFNTVHVEQSKFTIDCTRTVYTINMENRLNECKTWLKQFRFPFQQIL